MTFIAFIPARAGSQRIKNKNLQKIGSKPLIYYTIKQSLKSEFIKETVVLTDCNLIKKKSIKYGAHVPFLRPKKISQNNTPMIDTIKYAVRKTKLHQNKKYKYIVLLQATSPLRTSTDIDNCCRKILNNPKADCLVTTYDANEDFHPSKIMFQDSFGFLKKKKYNIKNRFFIRNGPSILITRISRVKRYLLGGKILNYIMPKTRSLDINNIEDLKKARQILK
jgi:CMP-N-acetylneuraminic acid synthetase